ncbi:MAG TPA: AMP-binding protein, partial [Ilumatobacter sp.]|nr:AMP-binding protein [Ilumatobacter sp.]
MNSSVPVTLLASRADERPDVDFLVMDDARLSFGVVDERANRWASSLAALGVGRGDTVAMFMENSLDTVVLTFAVNRLGAIWSPVNTDYRGEWLGMTLAAIGADVLVVDSHLLQRIADVADQVRFRHIVVRGQSAASGPPNSTLHDLAGFVEAPATRPDHQPSPAELSAILWTSGTTGRSKGVMQPHGVWLQWADHHNSLRRYQDGERFYGCTPMYNSTAFVMNVMPALLVGSQACIDHHFSVTDFWDRVRFYDANHTITLGTMHMYLWGAPARADDHDNPLRT